MRYAWILVIGLIMIILVTGCTTNINTSPITTLTPQIVYVTVTVPVTVPVSSQTTSITPTPVATTSQIQSNDQSVSKIQMIGNVYGISSNPTAGIDEIRFSIGLAPGAETVDLTNMKIIFSTQNSYPRILTLGTTASITTFTAKSNGVATVRWLAANDQVEIHFNVDPVPANTKMTFELKPPVGAALPFSKTVPATISAVNVLY